LSEPQNSFTLPLEQILNIKKEVEKRRINFPDNLYNIFYNVKHLNRQQLSVQVTMHENMLYRVMKKTGKYLKAKGFAPLVEFVRHHIVSVKEFEYCYTVENLLQDDDEQFISGLYLALFKRPVTNDEKTAWLSKLKEKKISKKSMIVKLYFTKERYLQQSKVTGIYKLFLRSLFGLK
jgi:hypothetical protein